MDIALQYRRLSRSYTLNSLSRAKSSKGYKPFFSFILGTYITFATAFSLSLSRTHFAYAGESIETASQNKESIELKNETSRSSDSVKLTSLDISTFPSLYKDNYQEFGLNLVTVINHTETKSFLSASEDIETFLAEVGIQYDHNDVISPQIDTKLADGLNILITYINESEEIIKEEIPYETVHINDSTLEIGKSEVLQEGRIGELTITSLITSENGDVVENREVERRITVQPINQVIKVGTKKPLPVVIDDRRCDYWYGYVDQLTSDETERAWLKHVMRKESGCNASNNNNRIYKGLFQFLPSTYAAYGGVDLWNGEEQTQVTLKMYRMGGCVHWNYCL